MSNKFAIGAKLTAGFSFVPILPVLSVAGHVFGGIRQYRTIRYHLLLGRMRN